MISEKKYYQYIYDKLIMQNENMFYGCNEKKLEKLKVPSELDKLRMLLDDVEDKYGFNMQKMIAPNYNKFVLWQKCFMGMVDIEKLQLATQFVVFCCLADKILDSLRFPMEQKEAVCKKLNIKNFISTQEYKSDFFVEMDILLNSIRKQLSSYKSNSLQEIEMILYSMDKAFKSEIYMYENSLKMKEGFKKNELYLLTDKSIQFELVAFMLSILGKNNKKSIEVALEVANIFWIIDDICDFIEDIKAKRMNSMLFACVHTEAMIAIEERVKIAISNVEEFILLLKENLILLRENSDEEFYTYILNEVWEWCTNVRKNAK